MTGQPGMSIPAGLVGGMPCGLQVVARRLDDDLCLAAGAVLEADPPLAQVRPRQLTRTRAHSPLTHARPAQIVTRRRRRSRPRRRGEWR